MKAYYKKIFIKQTFSISDESGATSVLVVFMMIVLVTLGTFAISSAYVNYNFSRKALEWNKAYYDCDMQAELFLSEYDGDLALGEKKLAEYLMQKGYEKDSYDGIPADLQNKLKNMNFTNQDEASSTVKELYAFFIEKELIALSEKYTNLTIFDEPGHALIDFQSTKNQKAHIRVEVKASPISYYLHVVTAINLLSASRLPETKRYEIIHWEEWQDASSEMFTEDLLWDGIIKKGDES